MHTLICRISQAAVFGVFIAFVALRAAGMRAEAGELLAPMWLLIGVQFGALAYGSKHAKRVE